VPDYLTKARRKPQQKQCTDKQKKMEDIMKNTLKKFAYVLSAAALITVGAANVYAMDSDNHGKSKTAYDVWQELSKNTSNS
jgi:hypothetical protein